MTTNQEGWRIGDRVETMDGRRGYIADISMDVPAFPMRLELDGEIGVFVFAAKELTRIDDLPLAPRSA